MKQFQMLAKTIVLLLVVAVVPVPANGFQVRELGIAEVADQEVEGLLPLFLSQAELALDEIKGPRFDDEKHRQLVKKVSAGGVGDALSRYLEAEPQSPANDALKGYTLELLQKTAPAAQQYRDVLLVSPDRDGVRLRLMLLELELGMATFAEHYALFQDRSAVWEELLQRVEEHLPTATYKVGTDLYMVSQRDVPLSVQISTADSYKKSFLIATAVKQNLKLVAGDDIGASALQRLLLKLSAAVPQGDGRRYFYNAFSQHRTMDVAEIKADATIESTSKRIDHRQEFDRNWKKKQQFIALRDQLVAELANEMIDTDSCCALGFSAALALKQAQGQPLDEDFRKSATDALLRQATHDAQAWLPRDFPTVARFNLCVRRIETLRSPVSFAARELAMAPNFSEDAVEALATQLKKLGNGQIAEEFESRCRLYRCEETQFADLAQEIIDDNPDAGALGDPTAWMVFEVWQDRGAKADIGSILLQATDQVDLWLAFLDQMVNAQRRSEIQELIRDYIDNVNENDSNNDGAISWRAREVINRLLEHPELVRYAAKEASRYDDKDLINSAINRYVRNIETLTLRHPEQLYPWLQRMGLCDDLETLDPLVTPVTEYKSILATVYYWIGIKHNIPAGHHGGLHSADVIRRDQQTNLVGRFLAKRDVRTSDIVQFFNDQIDQISKLPESQKEKIRAFGRAMYTSSGGAIKTKSTLGGNRGIKFLFEAVNEEQSPLVLELLNAETAEELVEHPERELADFCGSALRTIGPHNPEQFYQVMKKAILLFDESLPPDVNGFTFEVYRFQPRDALYTRLFRQLSLEDATKIFAQSFEENLPHRKPLSSEFFLEREFVKALRDVRKPNKSKNKRKKNSPKVPDFFVQLAEHLSGQDTTVVFPELVGAIGDYGPKSLAAFSSAPQGSFEEAWNWALAAASIISPNRRRIKNEESPYKDSYSVYCEVPPRFAFKKRKRRAKASEYQKGLVAYIMDDQRPLAARFKLARFLIRYDTTLPVDLTFACLGIVNDANKLGYTSEHTFTDIFNTLLELKDNPDFQSVALPLADFWARDLLQAMEYNLWGYRTQEFPMAVKFLAAVDRLELFQDVFTAAADGDAIYEMEIALTLIENKQFELAQKICQRIWKDADEVADMFLTRHLYSQTLAAHLKEFSQSFEKENQRYLAEVFFSAFKDVGGAEEFPNTARDERLSRLADQFEDMFFEDSNDRLVVALALAQATFPSDAVLEELATLVDRNDLPNTPFLIYAAGNLRVCDGRPMTEYAGACIESNFYPDYLRELVRSRIPSSQVMQAYLRASDKGRQRMSEAIAKIADPEQPVALLTQTNILLHVVNGDSAKLLRRYEQFPDGCTQHANRLVFHADELWEGIAMYIADQKREFSLDERLELIRGVLKMVDATASGLAGVPFDHRIMEGSTHRNYAFYPIMRHQLLTEDEVILHGPELAESVGNNAALYRHVALILLQRGEKKEAAQQLFKSLQRNALQRFTRKQTLSVCKKELERLYSDLGQSGKVDELNEWFKRLKGWKKKMLEKDEGSRSRLTGKVLSAKRK